LVPVVFALAIPFAVAEDTPRAPASSAIHPAEEAEALIERIRRGDPGARDEATRLLLQIAEVEGEKNAAGRPVHEVLKRALLDSDPEVRLRVRRVLADPEVRVERLLVTLLDPQQTEKVIQTKREILERADRAVARAGLVRIARKAALDGFNPLTSRTNETWHPWGLEGTVKLRQERRFHLALDLLAEMSTDEDVAPICALLDLDLGESLLDVVDALAARRGPACEQLRKLLKDPSAMTRENAVWALGELGTAEDVPALDAVLNDPEPRVRRAAVSAFENLPVDPPASVHAASHATDPDMSVAVAAMHLGSIMGHHFVADPAQKLALETLGPLEPRIAALRALGRLGDTSNALGDVAQRGSEISKVAGWALGASGNLESLGALENLASRDEFSAEPGIYFGIARSGSLGWMDRLVRSPRDEVRRLAISAFGSAKGDPARIVEALQGCASRAIERESGADWNDFLCAYRALRDRDDEPARKAMGILLDQALINTSRGNGIDDQTLVLLVDYAHQARATSTVRALEKISLHNRNQYVRGQAMDALATIDPKRARQVLTPLLDNPSMTRELIEWISRSLARAGDHERSERAVEIAKQKVAGSVTGNESGRFSDNLNTEGIEHAYAGEVADAVLCFRRMRWLGQESNYNVASYNVACCLAMAGDKENAVRWLRRSIREGFKNWRHISRDPDLQSIYEDVRFKRLVTQLREEQEVDPLIER
jgi:HEAT repeat protein